ncbi:hypothetical protein ACFV6D_18595, partial [Kitasatospora sp. NPDC059812]
GVVAAPLLSASPRRLDGGLPPPPAPKPPPPRAELVVTDPRDVEVYVRKFDGFVGAALFGDEMRSLIESIRDEFLREQEIVF